MKNEIVLEFPNTLSRITGNEYGYSIYKSKVLPKLKEDMINVIIFPKNITGISISFIKGLISDEVNKYGTEKIFDHFEFYSPHEDVKKSIIESVNY